MKPSPPPQCNTMSLTPCEECGGQISTRAYACPHCGLPLKLHHSPAIIPWAAALTFCVSVLVSIAVSSHAPENHSASPQDSIAQTQVPRPERSSPTLRVTALAANIRRGPSTKERILAVADHKEHLQALDSQGEWLKIKVVSTGRVGWIHSSVVTTESASR
jgi:hypothetical protein